MLLTISPAFPLSSLVESVWHYEGAAVAHSREHVLPNGRFQIVFNLAAGKAAVCGLRSRHAVIDTAHVSRVMGVVFRPAGALGFVPTSAIEFYDRSVSLDLVWGAQATSLLQQLQDAASARERLRILEQALTSMARKVADQHTAIHPAVGYAVQSFHNGPHLTVADVSREIGWSRRWFRQLFSEQVGMTPKRYCRLIRFQKIIRQIACGKRVDWADAALAGGFCDQAHLAHEFRAFSGLSPQRYLRAERPFPNHVRPG